VATLGGRAARTYGGFEAEPAWPVIGGLVQGLRAQPPGRFFWEDDPALFAALGSRHLPTLLPYWAPGHDALGGLWIESSRTAVTVEEVAAEVQAASEHPDAPAAWVGVVRRLGELGVRYFLTVRGTSSVALSALPDVQLLGTSGPFALFRLPDATLVTPVGDAPPAEDAVVTDREIRFGTPAPGGRYEVRVSWFPNWDAHRATIERDGPFMIVTATPPDTRLTFEATWAERVGAAATLLGVLALLGIALRARPTP
jgi:hypothetical protein